jgi:hypothetical protein
MAVVELPAKAGRLLRAVLMTAVEEDKILTRNPCRVRGAGEEHAPERPVLSVTQVFALAECVGRRPIGNIRALPSGGYRLRFRRDGTMRTVPEIYGTRAEAERALWAMADDGRADFTQDERLRAMVLLATFASLRWGEITALTRSGPSADQPQRTASIEHSNIGDYQQGNRRAGGGNRTSMTRLEGSGYQGSDLSLCRSGALPPARE